MEQEERGRTKEVDYADEVLKKTTSPEEVDNEEKGQKDTGSPAYGLDGLDTVGCSQTQHLSCQVCGARGHDMIGKEGKEGEEGEGACCAEAEGVAYRSSLLVVGSCENQPQVATDFVCCPDANAQQCTKGKVAKHVRFCLPSGETGGACLVTKPEGMRTFGY